MNRFPFRRSVVLAAALFALPVLTGANGKGCGGDVIIGEDDPIACTDDAMECPDGSFVGRTGPNCEFACPTGNPCVVTGCSGHVCADEDVATTCEWTESYACYGKVGICERDANGTCGWRPTKELASCIDDSDTLCPDVCAALCAGEPEPTIPDGCPIAGCAPCEKTPVTEYCIRNAEDACTTDADCNAGGCGGELCYNPAQSEGISDCDCGPPQGVSCGCVNGSCTWWQ